MRLQHHCFANISNAQIIQAFKLVYEIKLSKAAISNSNNNQFSSNSEADNEKRYEPNVDMYITLAPLNKIITIIKDFCNTCIKSKHIRIVKYKAMSLIVPKLEEIHINFWGPHDS